MSIFTNESILAWLKYFSDNAEIDLSNVRLLDITGENRNLLPTVQANRSVIVFTDGNHPEVFYSMWDAGMGDCEIWYNEGSDPSGPMKHNLLSEMIDRGVNVSAAMLINNPNAHTAYRIGLDNSSFSPGTIRYVDPEIRAVILKKLHLDERETICCVSGESIAVEAAIAVRRGNVVGTHITGPILVKNPDFLVWAAEKILENRGESLPVPTEEPDWLIHAKKAYQVTLDELSALAKQAK